MEQKIQRMIEFDITREEWNEGTRTLYGRPIVYQATADIGEFFEVIDRGALDEADLRDVALLVNHDAKMIPCARSRRNNANSTMQLVPDEDGLMFRAEIDTENNLNSRALDSAIQRGDITGMSFVLSFDPSTVFWEGLGEGKPTRHITRIGKLYEISAVTNPAYTDSYIATRNADHEALESALGSLEREKQAEEEKREEIRQKILQKLKLAQEE